MKYLITIFSMVILTTGVTRAQEDFFDRTQKLLDTYVQENGQVNYTALVKDPNLLNDAVYDISHTDLEGRSAEYRTAFYINAYNVLVIKNVVDNWPIDNPLNVKGFFDVTRFDLAGHKLTLNQIENHKLRRDDGDPRIHFALVCAGSGCPPLSKKAILPGSLRNMLKDLTKKAIATTRMVIVNHPEKTIYVSSIFEWYADDFGGSDETVISFINLYRNRALPNGYKLDYLEYDWTINGF